MTTHELKTTNPYFQDILDLKKSFEVRKNDRHYKIGDTLILREYDPISDLYSHREITTTIMYILDNPDFCKKGYIILQLSQLSLKGYIERMNFSDRHFAEKEFEKWCKETGSANCASSVFVWLISPEGRKTAEKICRDIHSNA